jgi:hypothetical protein
MEMEQTDKWTQMADVLQKRDPTGISVSCMEDIIPHGS